MFRQIAGWFLRVLLGPEGRRKLHAVVRPATLWQVTYERQIELAEVFPDSQPGQAAVLPTLRPALLLHPGQRGGPREACGEVLNQDFLHQDLPGDGFPGCLLILGNCSP